MFKTIVMVIKSRINNDFELHFETIAEPVEN
jgi:hypothetical protein